MSDDPANHVDGGTPHDPDEENDPPGGDADEQNDPPGGDADEQNDPPSGDADEENHTRGGDADAGSPVVDPAIRDPPRVLVPLEVLEGETIADTLVEFLTPADVVVLGYHVLPEQTPTEQASMQFEDRARAAVEDVADRFRESGRGATTRVAFTHDRDQTLERVAEDEGATAVLLPNPSGEVEDVLVPVRGAIDVDRLGDLVGTLLADRASTVTLWGLETAESAFDVDVALEQARSRLLERGVSADRVVTETTASNAPIRDVVDRSAEFDVVVMGEGGTTLLSGLFGDDSERVAAGAVAPVLVVRDLER